MDIVRQRLARTFLSGSSFATGREVVRALGAVQAQDYEGAKWALSQRTSGVTDESIEREFAAGHILRTHVLRPTWHFVDPLDIRWLLALTGPRVMKTMSTYDRRLGLHEQEFRKSRAALVRALRDGTMLTRPELKLVLKRAGIDGLDAGTPGVQRTAHLMMRAELEAVICSGARKDRQFTYALLDERVPAAAPMQRDEALLEITRRYFATRAPATAQDFSWWSGLAMPDVKRAIDIAREELESVSLNGKTYWAAGSPVVRRKATAHLLPNYDEFFIGYRDRSAIAARLKSVKAVTGGSALIANVVVMDGQLVGGWRRRPGRDAVGLDLDIVTRLSKAEQDRLLREVKRFSAFVARPVDLTGLGPKRRLAAR